MFSIERLVSKVIKKGNYNKIIYGIDLPIEIWYCFWLTYLESDVNTILSFNEFPGSAISIFGGYVINNIDWGKIKTALRANEKGFLQEVRLVYLEYSHKNV